MPRRHRWGRVRERSIEGLGGWVVRIVAVAVDGTALVAATIYVDGANQIGVEDGSQEHPYSTIQQAVYVCGDNDEIIVMPGTYAETVDLTGSGISSNFRLRSADPTNGNVIRSTIISGDADGDSMTRDGSVITLSGWEEETCTLLGLTITGGRSVWGGGVSGWNSRITIRGCHIVGNASTWGGGLFACHGPIVNCVVEGNHADELGGGLYWCLGPIVGCTVTGNSAGRSGGGLRYCVTQMTDSILWGNWAPSDPQLFNCAPPAYSCIQGWQGEGEGNTGADPVFVAPGYWMGEPGQPVWVEGDYRLLPGSACIDAADGDSAPSTDMDDKPRFDHPDVPNTGVGDPPFADMGALESTLLDCVSDTGWLRAGWNLISFPVAPLEPEASDALAGCVAAGNSLVNNMFRYSPVDGYELYPGAFTAVELERGYWLHLSAPAVETVTGEADVDGGHIDLDRGWNMIGYPSPAPILWAGCSLARNGETRSVAEAEAAGWAQAIIYFYDGVYRLVAPYGVPDDDYLRPWRGYWLLAYVDGLELIVPQP